MSASGSRNTYGGKKRRKEGMEGGREGGGEEEGRKRKYVVKGQDIHSLLNSIKTLSEEWHAF